MRRCPPPSNKKKTVTFIPDNIQDRKLFGALLQRRLPLHSLDLIRHVLPLPQSPKRLSSKLQFRPLNQQEARTLRTKGQRGELKEREEAREAEQQRPKFGGAEQLGQAEQLREEDAGDDAELEESGDGAADVEGRELGEVGGAEARVEAAVEADEEAAEHEGFVGGGEFGEGHEEGGGDGEGVVEEQAGFSVIGEGDFRLFYGNILSCVLKIINSQT